MTWIGTTFRDGTGAIVHETGGGWDNVDKPSVVSYLLAPGSYTVEISDISGRHTPQVRIVVDQRDSEEVVDLALPIAVK